jgi:hypothetical protein
MSKVTNINVAKDRKVDEVLISMINKCKENMLKEFNIIWEDGIWILGDNKIKFTKLSQGRYHNEIMDSRFIDFAKVYISQECKYASKSMLKIVIFTLRIIESTLDNLTLGGDVRKIGFNVLDESILTMKKTYSHNRCYAAGGELKRIALFLTRNKINNRKIQHWENPLSYDPDYFLYREGANSNKMPSEIALNAFAEIFSQPLVNLRDILTTSIVTLLMSAPSRISEILSLRENCELTEITRSGEYQHGLRFWAAKGYGWDIKWIVSAMYPVTKTAIQRIRFQTIRPRAFAKLMELNFVDFHRSTPFSSYSHDYLLTAEQVCEIISHKKYSKNESIKLLKRLSLNNNDYSYSVKTLWQKLQSKLPKGFPWYDKGKNIKYSDLLFLFFKDGFHLRKSENIIQLYKPDGDFFSKDIRYQKGMKNIFERYGYTGINNENLHFHSHQIRHLLNTIAQRGGLSEYEIAKWSGRANAKQNRVYNHIDEDEMLEKYKSLKSQAKNYTVSDQIIISDPVSRKSYLSIEHSAVHATEFGYCVHDYSIAPCEKFRDCINCSEQICIKGNSDSLNRLKRRLLDTQQLIEKATKEGISWDDKDRWLTFHLKTKERLQELIGILESKEIPDDSFVRLSNKNYSHLSSVLDAKCNLLTSKMEVDNVKKIK